MLTIFGVAFASIGFFWLILAIIHASIKVDESKQKDFNLNHIGHLNPQKLNIYADGELPMAVLAKYPPAQPSFGERLFNFWWVFMFVALAVIGVIFFWSLVVQIITTIIVIGIMQAIIIVGVWLRTH